MNNTPKSSLPTVPIWMAIFAGIILLAAPAHGQQLVIEDVETEGLERTEQHVVEREFVFEIGEPTSTDEVQETVQRLRNLQIFSTVEYELQELDETRSVLRLDVDERWTLLPIANLEFGGDITRIKVGLRDINLLGRFLELGAELERIGGVNSGGIWFRDPRLFGQRMEFGVEAAYRNRIYTLYDDEGEVEGGFLLRRILLDLDWDREIFSWLRSGVRLQFTDDTPSLDEVTEEIRREQQPGDLPSDTRLIRPGITAQLGRLDHDTFLADGVVWNLRLDGAHEAFFSTESFLSFHTELIFSQTLPLRSMFTSRLLAGATGADELQNQIFVGGLDDVRGVRDNRFAGTYRWTANIEYRIPSIDTDWVVLQHAVFADTTAVGDQPADLLGLSAIGAGVGLRLLSPQIEGLVIRLDYAFSIYGDGRAPLSFGGEQYF